MSTIGTYGELSAAFADWMDRDDLSTAQVANIVALAEVYLNRELPLRSMETVATLTGTTNSRQLTLPTDYVEGITLDLTTYAPAYQRLRQATPTQINYVDVAAPPSSWAIKAGYIWLDYLCDQAHTFAFRYRQKFALDSSTSSDTNWLLTNAPDVYLFACLVEAYRFTQAFDKVAAWSAQRDGAMKSAAWLDSRSKSLAPLTVDPALGRAHLFNINSGD